MYRLVTLTPLIVTLVVFHELRNVPRLLDCQQKVPAPSKVKGAVMVEVTGLHGTAPLVGVMVEVAVRVPVGVAPVGVRVEVSVGPAGVQVGPCVGTPKLPDKLLLDSLVSTIVLVESTVAAALLAPKRSVADWLALSSTILIGSLTILTIFNKPVKRQAPGQIRRLSNSIGKVEATWLRNDRMRQCCYS